MNPVLPPPEGRDLLAEVTRVDRLVKSAVGQSSHPLFNPPVDLDSVKIGDGEP